MQHAHTGVGMADLNQVWHAGALGAAEIGPEARTSCRLNFVRTADRCRVRRIVQKFRILFGDLEESLDKRIERFLAFRFGRLDHHRFWNR